MSRRNIILIIVALLVSGMTAFLMNAQMHSGEQVATKEVERNKNEYILVAKTDIAMGSFVRGLEQLEFRQFKPEDILTDVHINENQESIGSFQGAIARRSYRAGEAIQQSTLIKPGSGGFLSAVLEPGKRAVSIAVNATSGNAGFIFPGDYVDVILVHNVENRNTVTGESSNYFFSNTFIEKARVLAVDQLLDNPENKAILAKTVTIEVTPKQAEEVQVATEMGKVSFALRSISDPSTSSNPIPVDQAANPEDADFVTSIERGKGRSGFTSSVEVSPALNNNDYNATVKVLRGEQSEDKNFINSGNPD